MCHPGSVRCPPAPAGRYLPGQMSALRANWFPLIVFATGGAMGCFCLGAPPRSPNIETVKRNGKAAGAELKAGLVPEGEPDEALIGTAIDEPTATAVNGAVVFGPADGTQLEGETAEGIDAEAGAETVEVQGEGSGESVAAVLDGAGAEGATASAGGPTDTQEEAEGDGGAAAEDSTTASGDASQGSAGGKQSEAAGEAQLSAAGSAGGTQAAAEVELEAGGAGSSLLQEHSSVREESSQAALLPADAEVSLKHPRLSRLSSLLCGGSAAAGQDSEQHSRQEVGEGTLQPEPTTLG